MLNLLKLAQESVLKRIYRLLAFMVICAFTGLNVKAQPQASSDTLLPDTLNYGPTLVNCEGYQQNSWWLPDAYVNNATIACLVIPDEPKANIIRFTLQNRLTSTSMEIKQQAAQKKADYHAGKLSRRKYRRYVIKNLTPLIYKDHQVAYEAAGCKGDPAPYQSWKIVTTRKVKSQKFIWFSIRCFGGSCYAHFCRW